MNEPYLIGQMVLLEGGPTPETREKVKNEKQIDKETEFDD